jgi:HSP20 family protein
MATDNRHKQTGDHSAGRADTRDAAQGRRDIERPSFAPFSIMRQGLDEMERWVGRWGWRERMGDWSPAIEAFQRGSEFVIRVEAPGMSRQDLQVDISDEAVTVRGERREDRKEERDGMFWTERSYGSFARVIPLPAGAIEDSAKATFNNGVLEIVMQAPSSETRRGRRIDIAGGAEEGKKA